LTIEEQSPQPVQEESDLEKQPALPVPEDRPGEDGQDWAQKASRALEAREMGRKLRTGKRVLFPSRHSQKR
jgi:hypothetical protein